MINIACQTIVFGNSTIKDNLAKYAETVKKAGYDGVETGARFFDYEKPEYYKELYERLNLKLTALHLGGDFLNKESVKAQIENVNKTIAFGKNLSCPYLHMSGSYKEGKTVRDYATEAETYREIGKACNDAGIKLCFHNHDWEFYNNGEGIKVLLDKVPPELMSLCLDAGWAEQGGVGSVQFIKDHISRIETLHVKDYTKIGVPKGTVSDHVTEMGTGIMPLKEIYSFLTGRSRDWWVIIEHDQTKKEVSDVIRINCEYLRSLGKRN